MLAPQKLPGPSSGTWHTCPGQVSCSHVASLDTVSWLRVRELTCAHLVAGVVNTAVCQHSRRGIARRGRSAVPPPRVVVRKDGCT